MTRWFRMYDDSLDDEKLNFLSDKSFRGWFKLLCLASKNEGVLPPLKHIAFRLRIAEQAAGKLLDELCACGLLDPIEVEGAPMSYEPHNWKGRQYKSDVSTERVKRFRNVTRNANETFQKRQKTVAETPPDTEQNRTDNAADAAPPNSVPSEEVEYFRRIKTVCGPSAGGLGKKLLDAKGGSIPLARAAVEQASTKENPKEYIGAIIRGRDSPEDLRARGEAW